MEAKFNHQQKATEQKHQLNFKMGLTAEIEPRVLEYLVLSPA
jgi:hypothetical protein